MSGLNNKLKVLSARGEPINVGLIGAGYMGSGILNVIEHMKGIRVVILADPDQTEAVKAFESAGVDISNVAVTNDLDKAMKDVESGKKVATANPGLPAKLTMVDVVVDGTTSPSVGAIAAFEAITNGKQVVTANIEADVTIGHILLKLADNRGVVYSATAGDEPAVIKELHDHADTLGFEVVAAGKGKNNPLQVEANPDSVAEKMPKIGITARQVASFVDGSKTAVEMACTANATGLIPDVRGMHGPKAALADLAAVFRLKKDGGVLNQKGVVDYVVGGGVDPGVFLIMTTENARLKSDLNYLKVGSGPSYVLYHPYHLWFIDTALSVARAVLKKEATITPEGSPKAEVVAVAKRNLTSGEALDGIGGYTVYGTIEKWQIARRERLLPFGLTEKTIIVRDVAKGKALTYDDVQIADSVLAELRGLQNNLFRNS